MNQVEVKRQQIQIFSEIIGLITLLILGKLTGNNGISYIAAAFYGYYFVYALISGSVADSLGKILRGRNARGQYKNVAAMRKNGMILQCFLGAAGSILLFFLAEPLGNIVFKIPYSVLLIRILSPAIFLSAVSNVLLGYFQGESYELPTAATAILRQVFFLGFTWLFCSILGNYGAKVSSLLGKQQFTSMYGGAGAAISFCLTEVLIILFLLLIYKGSRRTRKNKRDQDMKTTESFVDLICTLYGNMGFSIGISLFERLPLYLGMIFFFKSMTDVDISAESYGLFCGKYLALSLLAICLLCGLLLPGCSKTVKSLRKEEIRQAKAAFLSGVHFAWAGSLFFGVTGTVLAESLGAVLAEGAAGSLTNMFRVGSCVIIFAVLSFYFEKILLLTGKRYHVLGCLGLMNVVFVVAVTVFLNTGKSGIMALVYGGLLGTAVLAGILGYYAFRQMKSGLNMIQDIGIPAGAAAVTGIVCVLFVKFLTPHLGNPVTVIVGFLLSAVIYWGILFLLRNFNEQNFTKML